MLAIERRDRMLEKLHQTGRVQVTEMSKELGVSRMTIHRDLDILANEGLIEKVFGGAVLTKRQDLEAQTKKCALCGKPIHERTRIILQTRDGEQNTACCPHCGLLLLETRDDIVSGLAADFIHGQMINIKTAVFLVDPDVVICCTPPVICFANQEDARRFQAGFNGQITDLAEARKQINASMTLK